MGAIPRYYTLVKPNRIMGFWGLMPKQPRLSLRGSKVPWARSEMGIDGVVLEII